LGIEAADFDEWAEACLEFLSPADKEKCLKIKLKGRYVCSRCNWQTGCSTCDWRKAARYLRSRDLGGVRAEGYQFRFNNLAGGCKLYGGGLEPAAELSGLQKTQIVFLGIVASSPQRWYYTCLQHLSPADQSSCLMIKEASKSRFRHCSRCMCGLGCKHCDFQLACEHYRRRDLQKERAKLLEFKKMLEQDVRGSNQCSFL
jgi:hypothetical protein